MCVRACVRVCVCVCVCVCVKLMFNMVEGGMEMDEPLDEILDQYSDEPLKPDADVEENEEYVNISEADYENILSQQHETLSQYAGNDLVSQGERLKRDKIDAWLEEIKFITQNTLEPAPAIYTEFELDTDERTLLLKMGLDKNGDRVRVTNVKKKPSQYLALSTLSRAVGVEFIRTYLFTNYKLPGGVCLAALAAVQEQVPAASENVELTDLPQWATEVVTAVKTLVADAAVNTDGFPMRELLGLDKAMRRQRGALVDNLAKLSQLDGDIAQAEQELEGEEAANDPDKKRRIQGLLNRLRDERSSRLEAAAMNREALRTQFSRIRETIERVLNEDTTLAERLRTLFREQGVTIASILTALGFIVSTIVLAMITGHPKRTRWGWTHTCATNTLQPW